MVLILGCGVFALVLFKKNALSFNDVVDLATISIP